MVVRQRSSEASAPVVRAPEDVPAFPQTPENTTLDETLGRYHREKSSRTLNIAKGLGVVAVCVALKGGLFVATDVAQGIQEGKERVKTDHAEVHEIYTYDGDDPLFEHHGTFVMTGLGTKDASSTAETLVAHRDVGDVYAIEYSNKNLNTADIATRIIDQAEAADLQEVSLDGYSMGGPIALDIASHMKEKAPDVKVVSVTLNSSPIGENGLTKRSEDGVRMMEQILSLHDDLVYYERGRVLVELVARSDRYLTREDDATPTLGFTPHSLTSYSYNGTRYHVDIAALRHELGDIQQKMQQPNVADANLISKQANILKMNIDEKIQALDDDTQVVYTRSNTASGDSVVNIDASEESIVASLEHYNKDYVVLREDVQHANPAERRAEYDRMIRRDIQPSITDQLAVRAMERAVSAEHTDHVVVAKEDRRQP